MHLVYIEKWLQVDPLTWESCLTRDFDYNSIHNTNILRGAFEIL